MHTQSLRGNHNPSLFPSPQVSLSDAPFLGAQGGDQSPLPPVGVGFCLGIGPGALPYPVAVRGELVHPSNECSWGLAVQRVGMLVQKRIQKTIRWHASLFVLGFLAPVQPSHRVAAQGADVVGISLGPPEVLQKPAQEKPSTTKGELENSGLLHWWAQRS